MKSFTAALILAAMAATAQAEDRLNVFYGSLGQADDRPELEGAAPFAIGYLRLPTAGGLLYGFDIAAEGAMLDATWGAVAWRQAASYNAVIGANLVENGGFRLDAGLIIGMRETFADCPDSYLGYQCYADQEPQTDYEANFGGLVAASFGPATFGLRATGESAQALAGFRF